MKGNLQIDNVILIMVDSFRMDRLGLNKTGKTCTPTLDRLAQSGISCSNAVAHGWNTQFSTPGIFSSSYPLDYRGYDRGLHGHSISLPEILQTNGFTTSAFISDYNLDSYFGYPRGFDHFLCLYDPSFFFRRIKKNYLDFYWDLVKSKQLSQKEGNAIMLTIMQEALDSMEKAWQEINKQEALGIRFPLHYQNKHRKKLLKKLRHEKEIIKKNGDAYLRDFFQRDESSLKNNLWKFFSEKFLHKNTGSFLSLLFARIGVNFFQLKFWLSQYFHLEIILPDQYLQQQLKNHLASDNLKQKNFLSLTYSALHDFNFSNKIFSLNQFAHARQFVRDMKGSENFLVYDLSLQFVDSLIQELISNLEEANILDSTLLVITSDHGMRDERVFGNAPSWDMTLFNDSLSRVPLIFWNPQLESQEVNSLTGLIDIAPSIVDILGIAAPKEFRGLPVWSPLVEKRPYLIQEHLGPGPGDLRFKAPYLCVRDNHYQYVWHSDDFEALFATTDEMIPENNLIHLPKFAKESKYYRSIAQSRFQEITSQKHLSEHHD